MKTQKIISICLTFLIAAFFCSTITAGDYYQLKVYTIKNADQEARVDNYLKNAFLPAMHRTGVKEVGVFKPIADDPAAGTKVFVFIPLKDLNQIEKLENKLEKDSELQTLGVNYITAPFDNPPYERVESILLKAFAEQPGYKVPDFETPNSEQIFELRSYQGATEKIWKKKVEMFNEGGETALFQDLDFNPVFFGEVLSGSEMPNLMYMTSFPNMKVHDERWDAFRNSPVWKELSGRKEYDNTVSHIDKWLLHPTEYSDF